MIGRGFAIKENLRQVIVFAKYLYYEEYGIFMSEYSEVRKSTHDVYYCIILHIDFDQQLDSDCSFFHD